MTIQQTERARESAKVYLAQFLADEGLSGQLLGKQAGAVYDAAVKALATPQPPSEEVVEAVALARELSRRLREDADNLEADCRGEENDPNHEVYCRRVNQLRADADFIENALIPRAAIAALMPSIPQESDAEVKRSAPLERAPPISNGDGK